MGRGRGLAVSRTGSSDAVRHHALLSIQRARGARSAACKIEEGVAGINRGDFPLSYSGPPGLHRHRLFDIAGKGGRGALFNPSIVSPMSPKSWIMIRSN